MAAATKEISMDAEAATVLSKPDGAFRVEKRETKHSHAGYFLRGKTFSGGFDKSFLNYRSAARRVVVSSPAVATWL